MCFLPWRWVCQILTIIKWAVGLHLLVAVCVLSHRFSLVCTIHLLCSRWDHRQSCCWSIRSESTWCLLARIPPETVTKILLQKWDWKYFNKEKREERSPALPSGWAQWKSAAVSRSQSWCRTVQIHFSEKERQRPERDINSRETSCLTMYRNSLQKTPKIKVLINKKSEISTLYKKICSVKFIQSHQWSEDT